MLQADSVGNVESSLTSEAQVLVQGELRAICNRLHLTLGASIEVEERLAKLALV